MLLTAPNGIKLQSSKAALEEMVGAGGNFGNSKETFGGNFWRKGLDFLVFYTVVDNKFFRGHFWSVKA